MSMSFFIVFGFLRQEFLCIALAILELVLLTRLALNLHLSSKCWE